MSDPEHKDRKCWWSVIGYNGPVRVRCRVLSELELDSAEIEILENVKLLSGVQVREGERRVVKRSEVMLGRDTSRDGAITGCSVSTTAPVYASALSSVAEVRLNHGGWPRAQKD